ncbi:glutathione S-transferase 1-like [Musca domestica]|uniref:Glutathione S-transferase 1-like n=2 Tax=Musca domestica TaxID=7370 RepID=A0A9J7CPK9_MUSDO|nr:glutathione S-transferase 1-like [Musca domestica]
MTTNESRFSFIAFIMSSKPILYGTYSSPTVNGVLMILKALNVDFEFREVRPLKKENQTEDFLKKNPTATIPTLETEDHKFIGDSHAIAVYIAERYGKDDSLYPKDPYKRAKVHQLQHFCNSILFTSCVKAAYAPVFARQTNTIPEEIYKRIEEAFRMLERFLEQNRWVACERLTIADFNCITSVASLYSLRPFTEKTHPRLYDWFQRMMAMPIVVETLSSDAMTASKRFLQKQLSHL